MIRAERAARLAAEARAGELEIARAALEVARLEVTQAHAARYALELEIERLKLQIVVLPHVILLPSASSGMLPTRPA
jgi:transposase